MEKSVLILAAIIAVVLCACGRVTKTEVKKFVFEECEFGLDAEGRKKITEKKDITIYIGDSRARAEMVHSKGGKKFSETKIVSVSGRDSSCSMDILNYESLNYKYCVKQYFNRNEPIAQHVFSHIESVKGNYTINGFPCERIAVTYFDDKGTAAEKFDIYLTDKIRINDRSGSKLLYPGFFNNYVANDAELQAAMYKFAVRIDYFKTEGHIARTFQLKSMNQGIKDKNLFKMPEDCPVYANHNVPQKILLDKLNEKSSVKKSGKTLIAEV